VDPSLYDEPSIPQTKEYTLDDVGRVSTMKKGFDATLDQAFDAVGSEQQSLCGVALEGYDQIEEDVRAIFKLGRQMQRAVNVDTLLDPFTDLEWKRHQASWCAGTETELVLAPSGNDECYCTGDQSRGCMPILSVQLLEDFDSIKRPGGWKNVAHWGEWYALFGVTEESCSNTEATSKFRKLYAKYRPEKHPKCVQPALAVTVVHEAGRELLQRHTNCGTKGEDPAAAKITAAHGSNFLQSAAGGTEGL
jgi:hypothetical protein